MNFYLNKTKEYNSRIAIISDGKSYSYATLLKQSSAVARTLLYGKSDLEEERIAYMIDPSFAYAAVQWGIWMAGGMAVPLCVQHPLPSIEYVLEDTQCKTLVVERKYLKFLKPLLSKHNIEPVIYEEVIENNEVILPEVAESRRAMILYTSGTTSQPKGVVSTHANIRSQITTLVNAWSWSETDHILNILPLHHVHGIINVMSCALWSGATCEFLPKFDVVKVWDRISAGAVDVFMAVPTIYFKLIKYWEEADQLTRDRLTASCRSFRLMVSGSAALPVSVLHKWKDISGHILLERYGMTEIGMGLSNPYIGERRPGHVGLPLPGVKIRLVNDEEELVEAGSSGEIQIKGPSVFKEYWQKPEATLHAFTTDGWFRTGDVAILSDGYYKILGRNSVDIIKSGGYKISALEIEEVIRTHNDIIDCGVIGMPDDEWGEIVVAAVVTSDDHINLEDLKNWLRGKLPRYRVPRIFKIVDDLPRNTLGKVTKKELKKMF